MVNEHRKPHTDQRESCTLNGEKENALRRSGTGHYLLQLPPDGSFSTSALGTFWANSLRWGAVPCSVGWLEHPGLYPRDAIRRQRKQPSDIAKGPPVEDHRSRPTTEFPVGEAQEIIQAEVLSRRRNSQSPLKGNSPRSLSPSLWQHRHQQPGSLTRTTLLEKSFFKEMTESGEHHKYSKPRFGK